MLVIASGMLPYTNTDRLLRWQPKTGIADATKGLA